MATAKPYEELPSLLSLPLIGTVWVFLPVIGRYDVSRMSEALLDKRKILGNIFREKFGTQNAMMSFNADDLQAMYKHEGLYPVRNEIESFKVYRESRKEWYKTLGLTILNGKDWWDLRQRTQKHLMKPRAVQAFLDPMQDVARDLVKKIFENRDSNQEVPDLLEELYKWSLESVALVGLDTRLGCLQANLPADSDGSRMINCIQTQFDSIQKLEKFSGRIQFWKYFPTPTWKKFVNAADTFTEIAFKHINRSMEKLKEAGEDRDLTLLQSLILTKGMDVSSAMVVVTDMLGAGIDTTSNTVGFFLYNIAKNPDKQEILYQELKKVLPNKEDRITPSIFNELRYLKACLKEAQRLDPIISAHVRTLDHDAIFSGYKIPAGTLILIGLQGICRDERYFTRPNEFMPERWLNKDENFHPFAFVPFGFGVRSCIGRRLAELEIISLTSELIRNFRIEYHHEDIKMLTRLVNVPDKPLRLNFIER